MILVVFRSRLREGVEAEYAETAREIAALARQQPGLLEFKTFTATDGERVTIATFIDREAVAAWRDHPQHRAAQAAGRDRFYAEYRIQVCDVWRDAGFPQAHLESKGLKRIPTDKREGLVITTEQLVRMAQFLSGRICVDCPGCRDRRRLTVQGGELRLGSSPDLSEINPQYAPRPRLIFYCSRCKRVIGYIQGDNGSRETAEDSEEATRWNHLEWDNSESETK